MKKFLALLLTVVLALSMANFAFAEELPVVTIIFDGCNVADDTAVMEKVNEYLAEKIGVKLEVIWGTWGDFEDKAVNLITSGDTEVDIYFTSAWTKNEYNAYAKKGYWLRLDNQENNLIESAFADIWSMLPEVLKTYAVVPGTDGTGVYAIPGYKDTATQNCWDVNVTLLEELGFTLDDVKSRNFFTFGDLFAKAKEVKGDSFYPLLIEPMVLERMATNSIIVAGDNGDPNLLSYYLNSEDVSKEAATGNVVYNKFATPEYKAFVEKVREYYLAGYIDPSLAVAETANDTRTNAQLQAAYLIGTQSYALGYETTASTQRNIDVKFVPCTAPYGDTTSLQGSMFAISSASQHPEEAAKFLNLFMTDSYLSTLLTYGVQDVHYTLEDGMVALTDKNADFMPWRNGMGNITILPPQVGEGKDFWQQFKDYYGSAVAIPIVGYVFDKTNVENETSALAAVAAQYALALNAGAVDPATELPKFLEALEAAGMQKYVDEANAQMAAFLEGKAQ